MISEIHSIADLEQALLQLDQHDHIRRRAATNAIQFLRCCEAAGVTTPHISLAPNEVTIVLLRHPNEIHAFIRADGMHAAYPENSAVPQQRAFQRSFRGYLDDIERFARFVLWGLLTHAERKDERNKQIEKGELPLSEWIPLFAKEATTHH